MMNLSSPTGERSMMKLTMHAPAGKVEFIYLTSRDGTDDLLKILNSMFIPPGVALDIEDMPDSLVSDEYKPLIVNKTE